MDEPRRERPPGPDGELPRGRRPRDEPRESDGPGPRSAGRHCGRIPDSRRGPAAEDLHAPRAERGAAVEGHRLRSPREEIRDERGFDPERRATGDAHIPPARQASSDHNGRLHARGRAGNEEVDPHGGGPLAGTGAAGAHSRVRLSPLGYFSIAIAYSWITGFAKSRRHIFSTSFRAARASFVWRSMRNSFELRTPWTPLNPRRLRALWTLSPSGSVTPFFSRISTRTWTISMPSVRQRLRPLRPFWELLEDGRGRRQTSETVGPARRRRLPRVRPDPWRPASGPPRGRSDARTLGR